MHSLSPALAQLYVVLADLHAPSSAPGPQRLAARKFFSLMQVRRCMRPYLQHLRLGNHYGVHNRCFRICASCACAYA
ncbi:hypothetical protein EV426DRAFT_59523 [Tirmania nivea]|nr:hypothetical protein EV426DRAFT_59523 [Tirmania nivea]